MIDSTVLDCITNEEFDKLCSLYPEYARVYNGLDMLRLLFENSADMSTNSWCTQWFQLLSETNRVLVHEIADAAIDSFAMALINELLFTFENSINHCKRAIEIYQRIINQSFTDLQEKYYALSRLIPLSIKIEKRRDISVELTSILSAAKNERDELIAVKTLSLAWKHQIVRSAWIEDRIGEFIIENAEELLLNGIVDLSANVHGKKWFTNNEKAELCEKIIARYKAIVDSIPNDSLQNLKHKERIYRHIIDILSPENEKQKDYLFELGEIQKLIPKQLHPTMVTVDLHEYYNKLDAILQGLSPSEQIIAVFFVCLPFCKEESSRDQVLNDDPIESLFPATGIDQTGRTKYKLPILMKANQSETGREEAIHYHAIHRATRNVGLIGQTIYNLMQNHRLFDTITEQTIAEWLQNNGIIESGRITSISKGIIAGFKGDLMQALYILVPQIEHIVRALATLCKEPIKKNRKDYEEFLPLSSLISGDRFKDTVDSDLIFTLEAVFASRYGLNVRNEIAHGALPDQWFSSSEAFYVWLIIIKICLQFSPYAIQVYQQTAKAIVYSYERVSNDNEQ